MPNRSNDTSASTARQVLHRAITAIENLSLLLQESETLAYYASLSLDALPWTSYKPGASSPGDFHVAGPGAVRVGSAHDASGPSGDSANANARANTSAGGVGAVAPGHASTEAPSIGATVPNDDDVNLDALDDIIDSMADFDPSDLTAPSESGGLNALRGPGTPGIYNAEEDRSLAAGRLYTLVIAQSKASRRTLRYCQRVRHALSHALAHLPRPESRPPRPPDSAVGVSDTSSFHKSWLDGDSDS